MKTIKQIADEIGVSRQAIHKRIKKEPLSTGLQGLTSTINNRLTISVDGENLIKQAFSHNELTIRQPKLSTVVDSLSTTSVNQTVNQKTEVDRNQDELYEILRAELGEKNKLIDEQQQTITRLTKTMESLTDALVSAQKTTQAEQLLHADTKRILFYPSEQEKPVPSPKGFWSRILGRKKST